MESSDIPTAEAATPGQRLRDARESAGISPREMADRLNWLPAHVAAIEEDRYETLRSAAFVRGYLRAYAKAMALSADELVASFDAIIADGGDSQQEMVLPTSPASNQKTGLSVILGTVIAVIVIAAIWWQAREVPAPPVARTPATEPATAAATMAPRTTTSPAPEAALQPATDSDNAPDIDAAVAETEAAAEPGMMSSEAQSPAESPAAEELVAVATDVAEIEREPGVAEPVVGDTEEQDPAVDGANSQDVVSVDSATVLQFEFDDDCWLEVRDASGALIYADLRRAGDSLGLDGEAPFDILAGNAAAVTLRYLGELFPVRTRPGRDTARFTVGEP